MRNLGKPVELAARYFEEGADEVCTLLTWGMCERGTSEEDELRGDRCIRSTNIFPPSSLLLLLPSGHLPEHHWI